MVTWVKGLIAAGLFSASFCQADQLDALIESVSNSVGVPPALVRTVAICESNLNPWALNVSGIPFQPDTKDEAIDILNHIATRPYCVMASKPREKVKKWFFSTEAGAAKMIRKLREIGYKPVESIWPVKTFPAVDYKKLDISSTDVGLCQINYKWHFKGSKLTPLFDPKTNIEYAAKLLKQHYEKQGTYILALAHYHNTNPAIYKSYLNRCLPVLKKELKKSERNNG